MPKLKAILAGATGFLGTALHEQLQDRYDFIVLRRDKATGKPDLAQSGIKIRLPKADVLFHVAGVTTGRSDRTEFAPVYQQNVNITLNLLDMCCRAGIPKVVFASSYIYGQPQYLPIDEKHPIHALTPYMHSKIISEDLMAGASRWKGLNIVSLRLFNLYGPRQKPGVLIPDILRQLDQKQIRLGDPRPKRDFVHVDDVVKAFDLAARSSLKDFHAINIGSGESYSVEQVTRDIAAIAGYNGSIHFQKERRPIDIPNVVADIQKAKTILGWSPRVTFKHGLKSVVESFLLTKSALV